MKHKMRLMKWWFFDRDQYIRCVESWMHLEACRLRYEKAKKNHRAIKLLRFEYELARVDYEFAVRGE
ncbi:MAG: hypothetical protein J6S67_11080 [Methanobrevibacter sp.]|nr:hypothetical protein [Methanobrevibacter sp.]